MSEDGVVKVVFAIGRNEEVAQTASGSDFFWCRRDR